MNTRLPVFLLLGLLAAILSPLPGRAQDAAAPANPGGFPARGGGGGGNGAGAPGAASGVGGGAYGAVPVPDRDDKVALQFPNNPATDLLAAYESLSGKTVIRDAALAGPTLTIVTAKRIPRAEAIRLLESTLLLNGYSLIPGPNNTVKVVNVAGKSPRAEGIPLVTRVEDLPAGDSVVSFYIPLEFVPTNDAMTVFQSVVALHAYGAVVAVPTAHALVVTENSGTIRELLKLKDLIDVPPTKIVSEFVQLRRADAQKVSDSLNKLIDNQRSTAQQAGNGGGAVPPGGGGGNPGQMIAAMARAMSAAQSSAATNAASNPLASSNTRFVPDVRTNRILVVTEPFNFAPMKRLVEDFDLSADVMEPFSRPLKYISAIDVLATLGNLISETKDDATAASSAASSAANSTSRSAGSASRTSSSSSSASGLSQVLQGDPDSIPPAAIMVGSTRLIADNNTNSIIVIGPPESVTKVKGILDKLDVRPKQIYLATVIGKLTLTNDATSSVNILQNYHGVGGGSGLATSSMNGTASTLTSFPSPGSLGGPGSFSFLNGLTLYGSLGSVMNYYVQILESTNRFTILSRPSVYTANNKKAYISSGQQVPIPQATLSTLDTTSNNSVTQSSTITYKNAALLLEVIPLINSEKEVTLQIAVQNDTLNGSTLISGNNIPNISSDSLKTTITVVNKSTIVLGGLIRNSETKNRAGVPLLKDIPVLGALFRSDELDRERDELVVLIQPTVIDNETDLLGLQKDEMTNMDIGPKVKKYVSEPSKVLPEKATVLESVTH